MASRFMTKCVYIFCAAVTAIIAIGCLFALETIYFLAFFAFAALLVFILGKDKLRPRTFLLCLFIVSFTIKLIFVLIVKTQPISDFQTFFRAAHYVSEGNYDIINNSQYFQDWGYQTGIVLWMTFFVKYFGAGVTFFKVVNCACLAVTNVLVHLFARRFASEKAARIAAVIYMLYPGAYFLAPVLTNQHLCNALIFGGLFLYTRKRPESAVKASLIAGSAGLIIALGDAVRPVGIIVVAAAALAGLIKLLGDLRKKGALKPLIPLAVMAVTFFLSASLMSAAVKASGVNNVGLTNNFPIWKFVIGFNHESAGRYSYGDYTGIFLINDREERQEKAETAVRERLSVPPQTMAKLIAGKVYHMWMAHDDHHWAFNHITPESGVNVPLIGTVRTRTLLEYAKKIGGAFYSGAFILAFFFAASLVKNGKPCGEGLSETALLLFVIFAMYFGAHLLIEVQMRYRDFALIPIFALAAAGVDAVAGLRFRKLNAL